MGKLVSLTVLTPNPPLPSPPHPIPPHNTGHERLRGFDYQQCLRSIHNQQCLWSLHNQYWRIRPGRNWSRWVRAAAAVLPLRGRARPLCLRRCARHLCLWCCSCSFCFRGEPRCLHLRRCPGIFPLRRYQRCPFALRGQQLGGLRLHRDHAARGLRLTSEQPWGGYWYWAGQHPLSTRRFQREQHQGVNPRHHRLPRLRPEVLRGVEIRGLREG